MAGVIPADPGATGSSRSESLSPGHRGCSRTRSSPRSAMVAAGPPLRREVRFALENDGWDCAFECEVRVSASVVVRGCRRRGPRAPFARRGARRGRRPARSRPCRGPRRRSLSKSATKARIEPERARRIVDIPRFFSPPIPARDAFVADLDTFSLEIVPGAPCAPPHRRPAAANPNGGRQSTLR